MQKTATSERELVRPDSMVAVESSTVSAVAYDEQASVLTVLFKSESMYCYYGVPAWLYQALQEA